MNEKLIYGLGISINEYSNLELVESFDNTNNIVYHIIAGVEPISILNKKSMKLKLKSFGSWI